MNYDIIVVGGGHAGVEAAYIASQFKKLKIAILTLPGVGLASAPCNPAIGGVGKGQVVREIDSLGGITGKLADFSGIQYRTLNDSKGFAVQSTRVQIDKEIYSKVAEQEINKIKNITVLREKVLSIKHADGKYTIKTKCSTWNTSKVIITVGTFLNGKMHTGSSVTVGGRVNCDTSDELKTVFTDIDTVSARFKTGTPARLDKKTINYSAMEEQRSDDEVISFHSLHEEKKRFLEQKSCYLTYTNDSTMELIRANKEKSPMFNGQIKGTGARYCPSIEDKAYRYPDKNQHHVFIEPEGLNLQTVYPSGISTSLPSAIQKEVINTIVGLEEAEILVKGYAVEYDVVNTTKLDITLCHNKFSGLYFAGQVNGTSGYEEAAGQGYIAGVNAALSVQGRAKFILDRRVSYIGVMVEDLISNLRDEPYRLFTARSENRLEIREDNATLRMYPYRKSLGLGDEIDSYNERFFLDFEVYSKLLGEAYLSPLDPILEQIKIKSKKRISVSEVLKIATIDPIRTLETILNSWCILIPYRLLRCLAISIKYEGYIAKANTHYQKLGRLDKMNINWKELYASKNISFECKERIKAIKPETFSQLKLIDGIRPATLAVVAGNSI